MTDPSPRIALTVQPYLLQNGFILTDLPVKDIQLLQSARPEARKRGEVLFHQGAFARGAFLLKSGKVKIFQETPGGQRQTLYIYSDGDLVGYRQLLTGDVYAVTAAVLENARIVFIPADTFRGLVDTSPVFARNLLTALAREFTVWMNRMTVFGQLPVRRRLVLALLILHEQYRQSGSPGGAISITRTDLAEYIGASLETVVRALHRLKAAGLVDIAGRRIVLSQPERLVKIFQEEG